jgi:hypothetical protein
MIDYGFNHMKRYAEVLINDSDLGSPQVVERPGAGPFLVGW